VSASADDAVEVDAPRERAVGLDEEHPPGVGHGVLAGALDHVSLARGRVVRVVPRRLTGPEELPVAGQQRRERLGIGVDCGTDRDDGLRWHGLIVADGRSGPGGYGAPLRGREAQTSQRPSRISVRPAISSASRHAWIRSGRSTKKT
jgi:hypothetical protein